MQRELPYTLNHFDLALASKVITFKLGNLFKPNIWRRRNPKRGSSNVTVKRERTLQATGAN